METPEPSWIRISHDLEIEVGKEIAKIIVNAGVGLLEMRRTRPTLEDVFIQLTTQEETVNN